MAKTMQMEILELRRKDTIQNILRELFESGLSHEEVASDLGISRITLHDWLKRLEGRVETRRSLCFPDETSGVARGQS